MGVIKKHYEDVRLSDEQKSEIKYTLKERFPQYARTGSEMEVKIMENERIIDTGARVKTHSKLKAGIAATAAAAMLLTAGVAAVHRMDTGISPGSAQMGMGDEQTGYIDDDSSPYFANARTIYNHLAKRTAEFEIQGIRYADDCAVINRDTVLSAREQNITCDPQEGDFVSALELASKLDEDLKNDYDIDLGELDFEFWIDTNSMLPQYVFIYPDESRSSWYSYPAYDGTDSDVKVEGTTVIDGSDEPQEIEIPEGYLDDTESVQFARAAEIHDTFFKALAESELENDDIQAAYEKFPEIFNEKLRDIYGDELDNIDFDIAYEDMHVGDMHVSHYDSDFELYDIMKEGITPQNLYIYVYPDESHETYYRYPGYDYLTVPDVTGMSKEQAESVLRMAGFNVVLRIGYDDIFPEDTITAIAPPVGQRVAKGSSVTLYISKGSLDTAHEDLDATEQMQQVQEAEKRKAAEREERVTTRVAIEVFDE